MSTEQYRSILEPTELLSELRRLLLAQHQADRLICRYLADLADGMEKWPMLVMAYGDVHRLVRTRFGLSLRSIRERIRVGKALRQLPALEAALMSGQLKYSRIREVTRVATPDTERLWLEVARRLPIRTLEERVADASGAPRVRPRGVRGAREGTKVNLRMSGDVWVLLKQAMQAERTASGLELTDEEALAAVARAALSHTNGVPAEGPFSRRAGQADPTAETDESRSRGAAWTQGMTHSGSLSEGGAERVEAGTTHSGSLSEGGAERVEAGTTHSGSAPPTPQCGEVVPVGDDFDQSLSPDAQLLLDLIRTGGSWDAGTLCEITEMHPTRLACALVDLEFAHLVTRGMFGVFEAAQRKSGGRRFKGFKEAG